MTTTLIAKRTRVGGLIETEGDVMVEGRVEGTIRAGGCVTIGVSGVAVSDVVASRALVLGILIGNVTATERVDVAGSARVVGDVRAPTVSVAAAGLVEGRIEELAPDEEAEPGETKPTLRLRSDPLVRPARPPSAPVPPVVAARSSHPPRSSSPARHGAPPPRGAAESSAKSSASASSMRATRDTPPPVRAARDSSPMRAAVPPRRDGDSRPPVREPTPTAELPASPARPSRHSAPTQPAEPAPPPIPRPPGRVRLVPRGTSGDPR